MDVLANATLVEIAVPGTTGDSGDPGTPVSVWTGSARGYLKRVRRSVLSGGAQVRVITDVFTILSSAGAPASVVADADWAASTVVIVDQRTATPITRRFTVTAMENRVAHGIADSMRLELEGERSA